jgi:uncharacterized membrane protein
MIKTKWESMFKNGIQAMNEAISVYKFLDFYKNISKKDRHVHVYEKNIKLLNDIIDYNQTDCKVLWEIINYLRNNHCNNA